MAPDIDELIGKINSLTVDKSRLKQKLMQLDHNSVRIQAISNSQLSELKNSFDSLDLGSAVAQSDCRHNDTSTRSNTSASSNQTSPYRCNVIADVKCSTSCEEDLLYMNELYKKRLEEYDDNWDFVQSKCIALATELHALQKHYALLKRDNEDKDRRYKAKCDELDQVKNELQTVVVNYETQLSAMSEHLSMLANRTSLDDI